MMAKVDLFIVWCYVILIYLLFAETVAKRKKTAMQVLLIKGKEVATPLMRPQNTVENCINIMPQHTKEKKKHTKTVFWKETP
jgi:hypothetical protein